MAAYFASDIHLRLDRPERGRRFAAFVASLAPEDTLTIVGDLCDFWLASRQRAADPFTCPGLRSLSEFRARGGRLEILLGNHDCWLGPYFERHLGVRITEQPWNLEVDGLRLHLAHGHLLGGTKVWKRAMETRIFLEAFGALPEPIARCLEAQLDQSNARKRADSERRQLAVYRRYAANLAGKTDLLILGHLHRAWSESIGALRLIILGDWLAAGSYLRVDPPEVEHVLLPAPA
ncbi:MAG: UDP-2,3-diacylglucosamine diphosphatase [Isosphaeraceae bacterium]|nr:UDP-2,3-diacylglucosamine diphosphatase [Isosphaeraceae bacterium]